MHDRDKDCSRTRTFQGYTLIEAFPGVGLVGPMAGSYLIEKLKMEQIGQIDSDLFPPIASIHNGMPLFPARIYKHEKFKLVLVMSEFVIPSSVPMLPALKGAPLVRQEVQNAEDNLG